MKRNIMYRMLGVLTAGCMMLSTSQISPCSAASRSEPKATYWWGTTSHALTADERELVERVVAAEARGESYECMIGVAQTIRERAEHWGMTVTEVVTARAQYAKPYDGKISEDVQKAVSAVFDEGQRAFDAYTTHFHTDEVDPWWNASKIKRGGIDGVIFWGADIERSE